MRTGVDSRAASGHTPRSFPNPDGAVPDALPTEVHVMPFPKLEAKKFASLRELDGISARTMEEHYELYKGYVGKTNEIQEKLATVDRGSANQIFSDLRALRIDLSFATGGVKNHELYFAHLGGKGGKPGAKLLDMIQRDLPSYDAWLADFKATGMASRG